MCCLINIYMYFCLNLNIKIMKNTILQNVIGNFDLMENDHFIEWFKENKQWMIEQEKHQIIESYKEGWKNPSKFREHGSDYYYTNTFKK